MKSMKDGRPCSSDSWMTGSDVVSTVADSAAGFTNSAVFNIKISQYYY